MANEHKVILSADTRSHRTEFNKSVEANKKFTLSIQNVSDQTKLFAAKTRTYSNMAGKTIAGFATVSIAAYAAIYKKQAEFIDQQAKTADRLGISTEALIGLQHAANQTGASTESLNMGLQRMTRRIGQVAATGSGEAAVALEQLGISIDEIKDKSPDQQFALIAEKMKSIHEQGQKVFLTQKLFDSEGVKLLNTLNLGADGIAAMITEAEELGITFSRIDASKVEMANDSFDRAEKLLSSFGTKLATETAPLVGALSDLFVETAKEAGGFGKLAQQVIGKVTYGIGVMANGVQGISILFKGAKVAAMGFSAALWQGLAFVVNKGIVPFANRVTNGILFPLRKVLELAQHIPGIGESAKKSLIELNKLGKAQGFKALDEIGETAFDNLIQAKEDFHKSMMEPLKSEEIKGWWDDVQKKWDAAAAKNIKKPSVNDPVGDEKALAEKTGKMVSAVRDQYRKIYDAQLEMEGKEIELEERKYKRFIDGLDKQYQELEKSFGNVAELEEKIAKARELAIQSSSLKNPSDNDLDLTEVNKLKEQLEQMRVVEAEYKVAREQAELQHEQKVTLIKQEQLRERQEAERKHQEQLAEQNSDFWSNYMESVRTTAENTDQLWADTLTNFSQTMSSNITQAIFEWKGFGNLVKSIASSFGKAVVQSLVEIGTQRLVLWALESTIGKAQSVSYLTQVAGQAQAGAHLAAINSYASAAAIPYVGYLMAPGAAAAAEAVTQPLAAAATTAAASTLASFDGGGYTGNLPRYGGVDGKGGFHAILHGNETVVDHSKGQSLGANVTVNLFEDASRAGSTTRSSGPSGEEVINIFVTSIRQGGEASSVLENTYGLQRQGF
ncbi:MAG: hypothetical protein CL675_00225 [Bdellovibrionaceae bacterium]|nr:hypothetical protein [Pseudobdellovibrionaceae bacterium]